MQELIQIHGITNGVHKIPESDTQSQNGANQGEVSSTEKLRDELAKGLLYLHSRANANTSKTLEIASFAYALIELLSERGLLSIEELDARKKIVGQRLVEKFVEKGMGVALTKEEQDKYTYQRAVSIDCENRVHLCKAACCRLRFALSVQDVEEGKVKWDLGHPYMIRQDAEGYCYHFAHNTCRCSIYENRPVVCRAYDCRQDKRIWLDFAQKVINPELESIFQQASTNGSDENGSPTPGV